MAWQQQQQGNYDNYGGYVDPGYGQNDQYYSGPQTGTVSVESEKCNPVIALLIQIFNHWFPS